MCQLSTALKTNLAYKVLRTVLYAAGLPESSASANSATSAWFVLLDPGPPSSIRRFDSTRAPKLAEYRHFSLIATMKQFEGALRVTGTLHFVWFVSFVVCFDGGHEIRDMG